MAFERFCEDNLTFRCKKCALLNCSFLFNEFLERTISSPSGTFVILNNEKEI